MTLFRSPGHSIYSSARKHVETVIKAVIFSSPVMKDILMAELPIFFMSPSY